MKIEEQVQEKLRLVFSDENLMYDKSRFAGGLTNYNYIMNIGGTEYVVREPGGMTDQMIDRCVEKINNNIASEFGVNSETIFFDEKSGIKISIYIQDSKTIAASNPCAHENLKSVSDLLRQLHSSPNRFPNTFDWQAELFKYEKIVGTLNGDFFYDYLPLRNQLLELFQTKVCGIVSLPCHNDTVPENFLISNSGRTYLIDWEYSGMNDPAWDVAAYIIESRLSKEAIKYFLQSYYGAAPTKNELIKVKSFMLAQDLLWTVWALIRHYNGDDFLEYCSMRYDRFRRNIENITKSVDYPIDKMV